MSETKSIRQMYLIKCKVCRQYIGNYEWHGTDLCLLDFDTNHLNYLKFNDKAEAEFYINKWKLKAEIINVDELLKGEIK